MNSLKQQLPLLIIGPLILLSIFMTTVLGVHMKDRALLATTTKAQGDIQTGETIIDLMYPGPWHINEGVLYKGSVKMSNNFTAVDKIARLTGDTVTIFLGDVRVSTTVREKDGDRAIGTQASEKVSNTVLKNGQLYLGEANVVGDFYQTAYKPIRDANGRIIGMFYVGISKKFTDQMINKSLLTIVLTSAGLTVLVSLGAWFFAKRAIVDPIEQITLGTKAVASGHHYSKVEIAGSNEIGELAQAFNKMLETMQHFAIQFNKSTPAPSSASFMPNLQDPCTECKVNGVSNGPETVPSPIRVKEQDPGMSVTKMPEDTEVLPDLPKGLNEATFRQILSYLRARGVPLSAEEVGEGVKLTRVTARRYLEFLEKDGQVEIELKYGTVGRPVKLYTCKDK